jgi:hypothetical protein
VVVGFLKSVFGSVNVFNFFGIVFEQFDSIEGFLPLLWVILRHMAHISGLIIWRIDDF